MRPFVQFMLAAALMPLATVLPAKAQPPADGVVYAFRYIEASADGKNKVPALLKQLADASRKEAGVVDFQVMRRPDPASQFLIVEAWKDQKALDAHAAAAHTKQFASSIGPLLVSPIDDRFCFALEAASSPKPASSANVVVVTHVDVNPPGKEQADALLKALATDSRKDNGNLRFDTAVQNTGRFNHFQVIEVWSNQKAADAHEAAAHTKEFRGKLAPLNGALYDMRWFKPL